MDKLFGVESPFTGVFKIYALHFRNARPTPQVSDITNEGIGDDVLDVTTRVTARAVRGVEREQAGNDTTGWRHKSVG